MGSVFVMGAPRSGIVPVVAAIEAFGVPGPHPADRRPVPPGDILGGGDSLSLADAGDRLLTALGGTWTAPPSTESTPDTRAVRRWEVEAGALAARVVGDAGVWGDHRLCLTAPFWRAARGEESLAVLVHRDPRRIAADLASREGMSPAYALALWERYLREAVRSLTGRPVLVVRPDDVDVDQLLAALHRRHVPVVGAPSPLPKPFEDSSPSTERPLSAQQEDLLQVLDALVGSHDELVVPELPDETPWTALLLDERCRADTERARLTRVFDAAVDAVSGLALLDEPRTSMPAWRPRYGKDAAEDVKGYRRWLDRSEGRRVAQRHVVAERANGRADAPTISVVVPVYKPDLDLLERCVTSVRRQVYGRWELSLCDDGSGDPAVQEALRLAADADSRIRVSALDRNQGISAATNRAVAATSGDFVGFLDQDDELDPGALAWVAHAVLDEPDADVVYTDEDKLDEHGLRVEPFFKPDWSPDQLLSQMYLGHFLAVRRSLFDRVGGLRPAFDGSQDYDLALRVTEAARRVVHVPEPLYHWRRTPGSTAQDYRAKPEADTAAQRALQDALDRHGEDGRVEPGLVQGTFRVRRSLPSRPLVSIIVPFRDGADLLARCVESLHSTAGYDEWEALLVDNQSWEPETTALLQRLADDPKCSILSYPHAFNWSAINNFGARHARGEVLLLLNSDIEGREHGWLEAMVEHVLRPEVGAVGSRLLYPDGRVQHAGVLMGLGGVAWHAFCFCPEEKPGYASQAKVIKNYLAVTGACLMMRRPVFDELGGIDERLAVAFSDIDLCLRAFERGYRVVYTPFAELVHYEGATRGVSSRELTETRMMMDRWERYIRRDPYFNPNLDSRRSEHAVPAGDEEVTTWERLRSMLETS